MVYKLWWLLLRLLWLLIPADATFWKIIEIINKTAQTAWTKIIMTMVGMTHMERFSIILHNGFSDIRK